jgi:site-specific DNA-cytosine methylase
MRASGARGLAEILYFENVKGLISMGHGAIIDRICSDMASVGYEVIWDLLNAADYGVPQNRERVFFIGQRIDALVLPFGAKKPQLYMGCAPGRYRHPAFFEKRHHLDAGWKLAKKPTNAYQIKT